MSGGSAIVAEFRRVFSLGALVGIVSLAALSACDSTPTVIGDGPNVDTGDGDGDKDDDGEDTIGLGGRPPTTGDGDGDDDVEDGECGNGELEALELCDDGNTKDKDGCSADCSDVDSRFVCIEAGESCIRVVTCGNGVLEGDEVCDDNNTTASDGCSANCSKVEPNFSCVKPGVPCVPVPVCGNSVRERGEQCDDGEEEPEDGDGCSADCQQEEGYFCSPGEACVPIACGDGNRTPNEQCDDGPGSVGVPGTATGGDGCSTTCTVETGWRCSSTGCTPICGNGVVDGIEQCDDDDLESGDGCSAGCKVEPYYTCNSADPSVCVSQIVCGNGTVDPGEVCDFARAGQSACYNTTNNPAQACKGFNNELVDPAVCGNGVIEIDEDCDGGIGCVACEILDGYACPGANYCFLIPACGDGIVQLNEECDPGAMSAFGCNGCFIETNYYCSGQPSACVQSICGDDFVAPDEQCDDGPGTLGSPGTPAAGDGCSASCTVETGYVCPPLSSCLAVCGNGSLEPGEQCEESSVGCTNCVLNPGYDCKSPDSNGVPKATGCIATVCTNGVKESGEGCDDGNRIAGDGCGPTCQLEPVVTPGPSPTVALTCGDGLKTGAENCDDGNVTNGDGCSSLCAVESGWYCDPFTEYRDSIQFRIKYRDFKQRNENGGHPHMKVQNATPPVGTADAGIVGSVCNAGNGGSCGRLDAQGKPLYVGTASGTHNSIDPDNDNISPAKHQDYFKLWYRDSAGGLKDVANNSDIAICANPPLGTTCTGTSVTDTIVLTRETPTGTSYAFDSANNTFYPLGQANDEANKPQRGWGYTPYDSGNNRRNWHFTSELRYFFQYQGGETLTFFGDDDVWVFINGRLAVDIGGIHGTEWGRVVLGDDGAPSGVDSDCSQHGGTMPNPLGTCYTAAEAGNASDSRFNLTKGGVYEIVVFQAERHPTGSNYRLTLDGFIAPRSSCTTDCGDGVRAGSEICDAGASMPASGYNVCLNDCTFNFCGDGIQDSGEQCDNGLNVDTYDDGQADACAPGCRLPGYCDDGIVQSAFEICDDGTNDGSYGGCANDCQSISGYCGDGTKDTPNETCDTPGMFTNYRATMGGCGYDCQLAGFCGDGERNGPELCDDGANNGTMASNCNLNCEFDPFCGDGLVTMGESCDYGDFAHTGSPESAPYGGCTNGCELGPYCGDGTPQTSDGEECDNGSANVNNEYNECTVGCFLGPRCGDGVPQSIFGEACDNGFNEDEYAYPGAADPCADGCVAVPSCGDGSVQAAFELCDDGAMNSAGAYNGCTPECIWGPYCGDGSKNGSEQCDDGVGNVAYSPDGEGCSYECKTNVPYCGDGERNGPEQCDEGTDNNDGEYGGCKADCKRAPRCGDGKVDKDEGETCDGGPSGSLLCSALCTKRDIVK